MKIDSEINNVLLEIKKEMERLKHPPLNDTTPIQARYYHKEAIKFFSKSNFQDVNIKDMAIDSNGYSLPIRIYRPVNQKNLPVLLYFHGGGWVFGELDGSDYICSYIAKNSNVIVISVAYRLSPEYKYPIPLEDAHQAIKWVEANSHLLDTNGKIAVGGESAGANLAASLTTKLRDNGESLPFCQLLITPVTQFHFETESYNAGFTYNLSKEKMKWFWNHYLDNQSQGLETYASPLFASPDNLPPTIIATAELDPLKDDGYLYAKHLRKSGVKVSYTCFETLVHCFIHMAEKSKASKDALNKIIIEFNDFLKA